MVKQAIWDLKPIDTIADWREAIDTYSLDTVPEPALYKALILQHLEKDINLNKMRDYFNYLANIIFPNYTQEEQTCVAIYFLTGSINHYTIPKDTRLSILGDLNAALALDLNLTNNTNRFLMIELTKIALDYADIDETNYANGYINQLLSHLQSLESL